MSKKLLIIFLRNPELGKVKTRLAATIGDEKALAIYFQLVSHTRTITENFSADKAIYYSDYVDREDFWDSNVYQKYLQSGADLGERMLNAFKQGFDSGYQSICIIGTDCWELTESIITDAFKSLKKSDAVIGPAKDGGYYLLGMNKLHAEVFKNKNWSTETVLNQTIADLEKLNLKYFTLPILSDVDEEKDLPDKLITSTTTPNPSLLRRGVDEDMLKDSPPLKGGVSEGRGGQSAYITGGISNRKHLKGLRKNLRNNLTSAEATLWKSLQKRQLENRKFRRQHSIGNYILDFYCPSEKLCIELDGQGHYTSSGIEYDEERTKYINSLGIRVVRFENKEVFKNLDAVLEKIKSHFNS